VGITKEQAVNFCKWRSIIVNEHIHKNHKKIAKNYTIEINYRLPTEKEWKLIAQDTNENPLGFKEFEGKMKQSHQQREHTNCKMLSDSAGYVMPEKRFKGSFKVERMPVYIFSYPCNEYGIFNTIGNVAEMIQEEGIAKGGSWFHTLEESAIKERQTYTKPTAWLGFRCVATVKVTPKKIDAK
jgi:formylglycine-generating enzyme required for sulfatase activity